MAYIDKEKLRMHIILRGNSLLKTHLSDEEKEKFLRILDEVPTVDIISSADSAPSVFSVSEREG